MRFFNDIQIIVKTGFGNYRLCHIAKTEAEANRFMIANENTGVIDIDGETGFIYIAENEPIKSKDENIKIKIEKLLDGLY